MTRRKLKRLVGDESGVSAVEFGLMIIPFSLVLVGLLDISYQMYVHSVLQGATNDAARAVTVEIRGVDAATLKTRVKEAIIQRMGSLATTGAEYDVKADTYFRYANQGRPERLTKDVDGDGAYDAGDCWADMNPNSLFDTTTPGKSGIGGADDVVQFTVNLKMPRLMPIGELWGAGNSYDMNVTTAIKRQPFDEQAKPAEKC